MNSRLDVIGIGNAMVDAIIPSDQEEIEKNNLNRNSMNLIDEELKNKLHSSYSIKEMVGGGSLGNSMFGITSFGGNGSFIGKIKEDEVGVFLQKDMVREGLKFPLGFTSPDISTGCCTIFVEQDGTRTMCTYLGAGTLIGPEDIKEEDVKNHQIAYLEGYLWDNNKDLDDGIAYAKSLNIITVVTLGEKGSIIVDKDSVIEIEGKPVDKVIDTTGAGDLYASGFLYGLSRQKDLAECGRLASIAASEIISHFGARPQVQLSSLI